MPTDERHLYEWDGPGTPVVVDVARLEPVDRSMELLLAEAPVGSTVVWKDPAAPPAHPFAVLPSVKLGPDEFAAHGLAEDRNTFSRAALIEYLRRRTGTDGSGVFVHQIEVLEHI